MQFVREFGDAQKKEYSEIFAADSSIIQIDPRFLRRLGEIESLEALHAYAFPKNDYRRSFADVGILHLTRLKSAGWKFESTERANKQKAFEQGLKRIFPFTPIFMHVPYPVIYRKGRKKGKFPSPFVRRGKVKFRDMTAAEIDLMDRRSLEIIPYARDFLHPKHLGLARLHFLFARENKIFC